MANAKAVKYILTVKGQQRADMCRKLGNDATAVVGDVTKKLHAHFAVEFPSTAHSKEYAHHKAFSKALRNPDGSQTFAYKVFIAWTRKRLGNKLPRANGKTGSKSQGVTLGRYSHEFDEKCTAMSESIKRAKKVCSTATLALVQTAVEAMLAAQEAIAAEYEEDQAAEEKAA
jgi:hypothetical protein